VASLLVAHSRDYYGRFTEDGFFVAERSRKYFAFGRVSNSMAPIARARVEERDGKTVISVLMRMKLPVLVVLAPVYVLLCLAIIPLPFLFLILHFAFFRPASRLQNLLREWL